MYVNGSKELFDCGVTTVSGACYGSETPEQALKNLLGDKNKWGFYVFADAQQKNPENTKMMKLKEFIEKNEFGPIIETEGWHYNEAHGPRYIKIYVWRPDYESQGLKEWMEKNNPKPKSMLSL